MQGKGNRVIYGVIIAFLGVLPLFAVPTLISSVKDGVYHESKKITIGDLRLMPVPDSSQDYAFLQCIDNQCVIVVGRFTSGIPEVVMYQDKNADGKVDMIAHWYTNTNRKRYKYESRPGKKCPPEKFKKMKDQIINGKMSTDLRPNTEGVNFLKVLLKRNETISKWKSGFRIVKTDVEHPSLEKVSYMLSDNNIRGVDFIIKVGYRMQGNNYVKPTIQYSVYCSNSKDKFMIETVKGLLKEIAPAYSR